MDTAETLHPIHEVLQRLGKDCGIIFGDIRFFYATFYATFYANLFYRERFFHKSLHTIICRKDTKNSHILLNMGDYLR